MLKLIKWLSIIILLIIIAGNLFLFSKVHVASNVATYQDKTGLNRMNIIIDTPNAPAKINPILAIVDAVKTYHSRVFSLDRINVEYQSMTATAGGHSLSKEPVYIVSFVSNKGYSVPAGPSINQKLYMHHEFNTVVDANNGETLFGFDYR